MWQGIFWSHFDLSSSDSMGWPIQKWSIHFVHSKMALQCCVDCNARCWELVGCLPPSCFLIFCLGSCHTGGWKVPWFELQLTSISVLWAVTARAWRRSSNWSGSAACPLEHSTLFLVSWMFQPTNFRPIPCGQINLESTGDCKAWTGARPSLYERPRLVNSPRLFIEGWINLISSTSSRTILMVISSPTVSRALLTIPTWQLMRYPWHHFAVCNSSLCCCSL